MRKIIKKRGQIWIETVIYTLIGLALIALVLAFIAPKLGESKDNALVRQSINSLNTIDNKINTILDQGAGNVRIVSLNLNKGEFYVNGTGNEIMMVLDGLGSVYSEPGKVIDDGRIQVLTEKGAKTNTVYLTINYNNLANITVNGMNTEKKYTAAPTPYKLTISNEGDSGGGIPEVRFS